MNKRERLILRKSISILRQELKPRRIVLFGSRAKGTGRKGSDFDVALDCRSPEFSKSSRIRDKLDRESGLYHIDLVFLPSVPADFRQLILQTGKVVYERRS